MYIHCNTVTEKKKNDYLSAICKENGTILTDEMLHKKVINCKPRLDNMRLQTINLQYNKFSFLKRFAEDGSYLHKTLVLHPELSTSILKF
jgi:hypothetical protein